LGSLLVNANNDSLYGVWQDESMHDTIRIKALDKVCWSMIYSNTDSVTIMSQMALEMAKEGGHDKFEANSYNTLSIANYIRSDYDVAIDFQKKSLEVWERIGNLSKQGSCWYNLSKFYRTLGMLKMALECVDTSLILNERSENTQSLGNCYIMLGLINQDNGQYEKSREYVLKSIDVYKSIDHIAGLGYSYHNLGTLAHRIKDYREALKYYDKSLEVNDKLGQEYQKAPTYNNKGMVYKEMKEYDSALVNYNLALKFAEKFEDQDEIAYTKINMGNLYRSIGKKSLALSLGIEASEIGKASGSLATIQSSSKLLWGAYADVGDYKSALEHHQNYITTRDSMNNLGNVRSLASQEFRYQYEKQKALDDAASEKKIAIEKKEKEKQTIMTYAVSGGLALLALFLVIVFNRLKVTRRQKSIIEEQKNAVEEQKEVIEEAHKEITDSINYAKRIQSAILPPDKLVKEFLQDSFILYKPKDIVAGDFYWMEQVASKGKEDDGKILFAAADCTGHGVPGAMVSVVCNNGLREE
jgi:tetratricopeptide (TPR) repeat protein